MRTSIPQLLAALAVGGATVAGGRAAAPLHDLAGRAVAAPSLPVAVVGFDGDVSAAVATARAAGAGPVWVALPDGDPRVGDALPDPGTLRAGADGRVRFDGDLRLPLPEALDALVTLDASQLGPGTPAGALAGRPVVLAWNDPATGLRVAAPGVDAPVDRARVLAVAVGARAADEGLRVLPLGAAAVVTGALTLLAGLVLRRRMPTRVFADVGAAVLAAGALGVGARALGWDLPLGGLLVAAPLAGAVRLALAARETLDAFDRTLAWLGAPPADPGVATGLAALAEITAVHAPGATVAVWRRGADGRPGVAARIDGEGALPDLADLPAGALAGPGWRVEPIVDRGDVVGALGVAVEGDVPADLAALLHTLARNRVLAPPLPAAHPADPFAARLGLVRAAVRTALSRAERWEDLLARPRGALGAFDLRGALVTGSEAVRAACGDGARPPLLVAVTTLSGLSDAEARPFVRAALGGDAPVRIPARAPNEELVLTPLGTGAGRDGVLLQVHDVTAHRRATRLGTSIVAATGGHVRTALGALGGEVARMVDEPDPARRAEILARVDDGIDGLCAVLERAERLAGAGPDGGELEPIYLPALVAEATAALRPGRRERVSVAIDDAGLPVAGRADALLDAVALLLDEVSAVGSARVRARTEDGRAVLEVHDDAGGLPAPVTARLVEREGGAAAARRLVERMGGELRAVALPGRGTRFEIHLGYF